MVKVSDYPGMYLNYIDQETVKLSMIKYLYSVLQELPENLGATKVSPAAEHLFKVCNERKTQYLP